MKGFAHLVLAFAVALLVSFGLYVSENVGRREGYQAGLQQGAKLKEAEMLRSFEDVRRVAVDSLSREFECRFGKDFGKDPFDD